MYHHVISIFEAALEVNIDIFSFITRFFTISVSPKRQCDNVPCSKPVHRLLSSHTKQPHQIEMNWPYWWPWNVQGPLHRNWRHCHGTGWNRSFKVKTVRLPSSKRLTTGSVGDSVNAVSGCKRVIAWPLAEFWFPIAPLKWYQRAPLEESFHSTAQLTSADRLPAARFWLCMLPRKNFRGGSW